MAHKVAISSVCHVEPWRFGMSAKVVQLFLWLFAHQGSGEHCPVSTPRVIHYTIILISLKFVSPRISTFRLHSHSLSSVCAICLKFESRGFASNSNIRLAPRSGIQYVPSILWLLSESQSNWDYLKLSFLLVFHLNRILNRRNQVPIRSADPISIQ